MFVASGLDGCGAVGSNASRRRKLRRLRCHRNHEQLTVCMAVAAATHHSWRFVTSSSLVGVQAGAPWREHYDMTVSEEMDQVVNVTVPQEEEHFSERLEEQMTDVPFPQERVFDVPTPQLVEE